VRVRLGRSGGSHRADSANRGGVGSRDATEAVAAREAHSALSFGRSRSGRSKPFGMHEDPSDLRNEPDRWRGVVRQAAARTRAHPFWGHYLDAFEKGRRGVHLIILKEPEISKILFGVKTLDVHGLRSSRPPFEEVAKGDIVFIKARGGDICGLARVARALMFSEVVEEDWNRLIGAASSRPDY